MTGRVLSFRKRPVVIQAMRYDGTNADAIREWTGGAADYEHRTTGGLCIKTLEGPIWVWVGDWIIRGVQGEFYPCKPDIFDATYEAAP